MAPLALAKEKYIISGPGALAQLGERIVRNDEVVGSIPICSTTGIKMLSQPESVRPRQFEDKPSEMAAFFAPRF